MLPRGIGQVKGSACVCRQCVAPWVFSNRVFLFFPCHIQSLGTKMHYSPITLITAGENSRE